jgi:hypothetical protein
MLMMYTGMRDEAEKLGKGEGRGRGRPKKKVKPKAEPVEDFSFGLDAEVDALEAEWDANLDIDGEIFDIPDPDTILENLSQRL